MTEELAEQQGPTQNLLQDPAYHLSSRGVIQCSGTDGAEACISVLQTLVCSSLDALPEKAVFTHVLNAEGCLFADLFVWEHESSLLIECARRTIPELRKLIYETALPQRVQCEDVSDQWRVFARLPDQNYFDDGTLLLRCTDPRRHMGARMLRPASLPRSYDWGSELKWVGHALKLGFLPTSEVLTEHDDLSLTPLEAGLHALNLLERDRLPEKQQKYIDDPKHSLRRRLLPVRIEPNAFVFADMGGTSIAADELVVGRIITHQSLYGLALVHIEPWRKALAAGKELRCCDQQVLITWPSWLAQESLGRGGPVAMAN
ncbi:MAG: hypothetical protein AAF098_00395 [Pseudomonadota bacterium]